MSRRPSFADVALAAALAVFAVGEVAATDPSVGGFLLAVALPIPLAWRRLIPVVAALAVLVIVALDSLAGGGGIDFVFATVAIIVAVYSLGAHADLRRGVLALVACLAVAWSSVAASDEAGASDYGFAAVLVLATWAVGRIAGARLAAAVAERERADRAVVEERARIARELHDVVAHAVGVIVVQAGAAEQVLESDPPAARQALGDIRRTGKEALVDLRRMLGVLREDGAAPEVEPQPGIADLESLAERIRQAGLPVELTVAGPRRSVPPGIALTVYRVAQEALTNVLKHGGVARAEVILRYGGDTLELSVTDDGRPAAGSSGPGHGLLGMRERVTLYGGELEAGPVDGGGFRVRVSLPYG